MKVKLKGWQAVGALAVIVALLAGRYMAERSELETGAAEQIKFWLRGEYESRGLQGFDPARAEETELTAKAKELLALDDIVFRSVKARGSGDDVVVRVEIQVAGKDPPDGKRVRYYKMYYSPVTGWHVKRETWALSYYLKLL